MSRKKLCLSQKNLLTLFQPVRVGCMKSMAGKAETTREYGDVPLGAALKKIAPWGTSRQLEFAVRSCRALIATRTKLEGNQFIEDFLLFKSATC
jgi:hypothetical protein